MESSPLVTPEDVLESLMNDGTIDSIRLKIINQLKANEELKSTTIKMVEQSKVLNTPGAEKQTKRELFDSLRQELEAPVLEKASKSVWELILDENGLGKEISEEVEKVYCRLSGQEPPLYYPYPESQTQEQNEKQSGVENKGKEKLKEKEIEKGTSESGTKKKKHVEVDSEVGGKSNGRENEKENSESVKKKRKYVEANSESGRGDEGGSRSNVKPGLIEDSGKSHLPLS